MAKINYFPTFGFSPEQIKEYYLNRFEEKFKDKFDYSLITEIRDQKSTIQIICKTHGVFTTTVGKHVRCGTGCSNCGKAQCHVSKTFTHKEFVSKVDAVYPERKWSFITEYEHNKKHIYLKDEYGFEHKIFPQTILHQRDSLTVKSAIDKTSYIKHKFNLIHDGKYDYDKFVYKGSLTKSTVTCKVHGDYLTKPNWHLSGRGCQKCYREAPSQLRSNTLDFIDKCKKIHPNKYDYSKVEYIHAREKVTITCKIHGDFDQIPNSALSGYGCPKCVIAGYKRTEYIQRAKGREASVYVLKLSKGGEVLYKVGITYMGIDRRYRREMPYDYEVVADIKMEAGKAWDTEKYILNKFHQYKYTPLIDFQGRTECLSIEAPIDKLIKEIVK